MWKVLAVLATITVVSLSAVPAVEAAGYCPSRPGGKCPEQVKRPSKNRSDFSAKEREELMKQARKTCKEKYGAEATVYRLDYKKWKLTCTLNTR